MIIFLDAVIASQIFPHPSIWDPHTSPVPRLDCRLLFEPAPGIGTNLDFLLFGKSYALRSTKSNQNFISGLTLFA